MKIFVVTVLGLTALACAGQKGPENLADTMVEDSIHPVYVTTGSWHSDNFDERVLVPAYRASTAVFIADKVMATSITALPKAWRSGEVDPSRIMIRDGMKSFKVKEVVFPKSDPNIVLLVTEKIGRPMRIRIGKLLPDEVLRYVGYSFVRMKGFQAVPRWSVGDVKQEAKDLESSSSLRTFYAEVKLHPGLSGAPVIDESGYLVGLIHLSFPGSVASIISNAALQKVKRELSLHEGS